MVVGITIQFDEEWQESPLAGNPLQKVPATYVTRFVIQCTDLDSARRMAKAYAGRLKHTIPTIIEITSPEVVLDYVRQKAVIL